MPWDSPGRRSRDARDGEAELARLALVQALEEMAPAQSDVAVVAADLGLRAGGDRMALLIDAQVHRRLSAAFANRLQFDERVGEREQRCAPLEEFAEKVGAKSVAQHWNAELVADPRELKDVVAGQELRLVDQHAVKLAALQFLADRVE